jgi:hypothetical protein
MVLLPLRLLSALILLTACSAIAPSTSPDAARAQGRSDFTLSEQDRTLVLAIRKAQAAYPDPKDNRTEVRRSVFLVLDAGRNRIVLFDRVQGEQNPLAPPQEFLALARATGGHVRLARVYDIERRVQLDPKSVEGAGGLTYYRIPIGRAFDVVQVAEAAGAFCVGQDFDHFMTDSSFPNTTRIRLGIFSTRTLSGMSPFRVLENLDGASVDTRAEEDADRRGLQELLGLIADDAVRATVPLPEIKTAAIYDFTRHVRFKEVFGIRLACR